MTNLNSKHYHYETLLKYKHWICRKQANGGYKGTTWQIRFQFDDKMKNVTGNFKLRIALATSNVAELQVRISSCMDAFFSMKVKTFICLFGNLFAGSGERSFCRPSIV